MPRKFGVGDKVKVVKQGGNGWFFNKVGTIIKTDGEDYPYTASFETKEDYLINWYFRANELELIEREVK